MAFLREGERDGRAAPAFGGQGLHGEGVQALLPEPASRRSVRRGRGCGSRGRKSIVVVHLSSIGPIRSATGDAGSGQADAAGGSAPAAAMRRAEVSRPRTMIARGR